jgi:hypothetical protein
MTDQYLLRPPGRSRDYFLSPAPGQLLPRQTKGQVYYARIDATTGKRSQPIGAPGEARGRKYPAVAENAKGATVLVWTEGMGWNRGGSLVWQVYDKAGKATAEKGKADGVPTWSLPCIC